MPPLPPKGRRFFNQQMNKPTTSRHNGFPLVLLAGCVLLSLLGHGLAAVALERFGPYQLGAAVSEPATLVMVDLARPSPPKVVASLPPLPPSAAKVVATVPPLKKPEPMVSQPSPSTEPTQAQPEQAVQLPPHRMASVPSNQHDRHQHYLHGNQIFPHQQEKLVYQISLAGMPVGNAQLEATNQQGELRIRTSVSSNSVISAIYPVHNSTDTRLIKGRYLLTRIRQQEGTFKSDTGFNLMYPEQKIFWVDRVKNQFSNEPLESLDTLDFVSGFYFLRLQPLKPGDRLTLRLYDGDTTTQVPVAVLRQEQLALPGLRSAATVVVQPQFAQSGFFRNNRDLLFWFTDDQHHLPVRIEATTPIGRVVAELISSERTLVAPPTTPASTVVPDTKMQYN
jgi:hypothetical protein